jgi:hypothetical protein
MEHRSNCKTDRFVQKVLAFHEGYLYRRETEMAKTFAQTVADAQLMKAALKSNLKTLENRG